MPEPLAILGHQTLQGGLIETEILGVVLMLAMLALRIMGDMLFDTVAMFGAELKAKMVVNPFNGANRIEDSCD